MSRITSAVLARLAKLMRLVFLIMDGMPSSMKVRSVRYTPGSCSQPQKTQGGRGEATLAGAREGRLTEEGDARRVGHVQRFPILAEVLGAGHQLSHALQGALRLLGHNVPGALQPS